MVPGCFWIFLHLQIRFSAYCGNDSTKFDVENEELNINCCSSAERTTRILFLLFQVSSFNCCARWGIDSFEYSPRLQYYQLRVCVVRKLSSEQLASIVERTLAVAYGKIGELNYDTQFAIFVLENHWRHINC